MRKLLIFLLTILIPACNSSSPAFHMMCSMHKLNKQGDNKQFSHTLFSILKQLVAPYRVITVASWPAYRFLKRQVRWPGIPIYLRVFHSLFMIHRVKGFNIVIETEVDVFLEFPSYLYDPADTGNWISGSFAFSKPNLNIWNDCTKSFPFLPFPSAQFLLVFLTSVQVWPHFLKSPVVLVWT